MTTYKTPILRVENLTVYSASQQGRQLVRSVSFTVNRLETLAVVGESGAGKSLALRAVCGLLPAGLHAQGSVQWRGQTAEDLARARARQHRVLYLSQQSMSAFDPLRTIGAQIKETMRVHFPTMTDEAMHAKIIDTLAALRFTDPQLVMVRYPCELSGGMLQRCMVAIAVLLKPELIVADEPTSALDVVASLHVRRELEQLKHSTGASLVLVTHDLAFAQAMADRIIVMKDGDIVEAGDKSLLQSSQHSFVRHMIAMRNKLQGALMSVLGRDGAQNRTEAVESQPTFLTVRDVTKSYGSSKRSQSASKLVVLDRMSFDIGPNEIVGLVGASGEGKSTLSRLLLGLEKPDQGQILIEGMPVERWQRAHPCGMSLVSQNYVDSVDPHWCVADILREPLRMQMRGADAEKRRELLHAQSTEQLALRLQEVGLSPRLLESLPNELSGGQIQRVCIARALIAKARFIVFDEALSSLDASVQGEIVELLQKLAAAHTTWLFISHDLKVVCSLCTRVLFLHRGKIDNDVPIEALASVQTPTAKALIEAARQ